MKIKKILFDHCKYNNEKKTIRQLLIDDKITNDEDEIFEELAKYYKKLYREKHMISTFHPLEVESYKLMYSEKEYCDRDISIQKLRIQLNQ